VCAARLGEASNVSCGDGCVNLPSPYIGRWLGAAVMLTVLNGAALVVVRLAPVVHPPARLPDAH
jgi:hypothetical protein